MDLIQLGNGVFVNLNLVTAIEEISDDLVWHEGRHYARSRLARANYDLTFAGQVFVFYTGDHANPVFMLEGEDAKVLKAYLDQWRDK